MRIKLTQNKFAIVDKEDYKRVNSYKWIYSAGGYAVRTVYRPAKHSIWMHRYVLNTRSIKEVDHINGNKLDNRKSNLRLVSHHQNVMNVSKRKNCSSNYKGVCWKKQNRKWYAYIRVNTKRISLGYYDNEKLAARIYNQAAKKYFGKFAKLNKIGE